MEPVAPAAACATGLLNRDVAWIEAAVEQGALVRVARVGLVAALVYVRTLLSSMPRCAHGRRPDCVADAVQSPPARRHCEFPPLRATATLTEKVRRRVVRWFRIQRLLDADAAADMLRWENSGFSVDASVRITLIDRDVPSYFKSLEHLLRYCARPPFALERLSVIRGEDGGISRVCYVLPRIGRPMAHRQASAWRGGS